VRCVAAAAIVCSIQEVRPVENLSEIWPTKAFWLHYQGVKDDAEPAQCDHLVSRLYKPINIRLLSSGSCTLKLKIRLDYWMITLSLLRRGTRKHLDLGWWDEARWHPFALRWQELEKMVAYWRNRPEDCPCGVDVSLLLLARFVGNGISEKPQVPERKERVAEAYRALALFSHAEVENLVRHSLHFDETEDYDWYLDPELGWLFVGAYPCYSLRNRDHVGSQEREFPFSEWNNFIESLT
jgi:hypothetical protein